MSADEPIHVTEAESEILVALWRHGPLTPASLVQAVQKRREWGDATVKTLVGRLLQKKALRSERDDGRLLYCPLIERSAFIEDEIGRLAARLFDGDRAALRAFMDAVGG